MRVKQFIAKSINIRMTMESKLHAYNGPLKSEASALRRFSCQREGLEFVNLKRGIKMKKNSDDESHSVAR